MYILKHPKLGSVLPCAYIFLVAAPFAPAQEHLAAPPVVTRYCSSCHGMDGKSQLPYIPRLAGLSAKYTAAKLASFRAVAPAPVDETFSRVAHLGSAVKDPHITSLAAVHMVGIARTISPEAVKAASAWYAAQTPANPRGTRGRLIDEGKDLFINGLESQNLPACQTCHGSEAEGTDKAPRLAGQNAAYIVNQLALFRSGERHNAPEMSGVARYVESAQARALAAYLQSR